MSWRVCVCYNGAYVTCVCEGRVVLRVKRLNVVRWGRRLLNTFVLMCVVLRIRDVEQFCDDGQRINTQRTACKRRSPLSCKPKGARPKANGRRARSRGRV